MLLIMRPKNFVLGRTVHGDLRQIQPGRSDAAPACRAPERDFVRLASNIRKRIHLRKGVAIFADAGDRHIQTHEQAELLAYSLFAWTSGGYAFEEGEPDIDDSLAFEGSPSTVILEGRRRIDELEPWSG